MAWLTKIKVISVNSHAARSILNLRSSNPTISRNHGLLGTGCTIGLRLASGSNIRLLKTRTYEFCDRSPSSAVGRKYAILSHTWEQDIGELLYEDLKPRRLQATKQRRQFRKLRFLSEQAEKDSLQFVWLDSCCIDKRNSSELTEAINSMYGYYSAAEICYVYLVDVFKAGGDEQFRRSRWFTRAWTLQELLAPREVRFYDSDWTYLGSLNDPHYTKMVSEITGIDPDMLKHKKQLSDFSIAERMSWAAGRQATRLEDRAYSLLGLFNANMPMLYGEGQKAFYRLQLEIIKTSTDHSIFCWDYPKAISDLDSNSSRRELFAPSPSCFAGFGNVLSTASSLPQPFQMTNRGLEITIPIRSYLRSATGERLTYAKLNCTHRNNPKQLVVLNIQKQYDLDAVEREKFKPWSSFSERKRQEVWDNLCGKDFDWQFVSSHARRGFVVGHEPGGRRVCLASDSEGMFREQTISILRESPLDNREGHIGASSTTNPSSHFSRWGWIARGAVYASFYSVVVGLVAVLAHFGN